MEIIISLSSVLILLVASVFKINPYLKLVLGGGLFTALALNMPLVMISPIFIAQCLVLLVLVTCTFIEKFNEPVLDLIFIAVPCLFLNGLGNLVETFLILNLVIFALYFHSRGSLDRGLLKYVYSFSAGLDYLFISLVSARYFHSSSEITFAEVEYYLRESNSLYLLVLPIVSITLKIITPLFCLSSETRSRYYRYYILQSIFLLAPIMSHKQLFIEGLKSIYYVWTLIAILLLIVVFFVRTYKIERLLMFGLYTIFLSSFAFDTNILALIVFATVYLIHRLIIGSLAESQRDLVNGLLGLLMCSVYIHLAIANSNFSLVFIMLALFQFFYTLSPMLINKPQEELK